MFPVFWADFLSEFRIFRISCRISCRISFLFILNHFCLKQHDLFLFIFSQVFLFIPVYQFFGFWTRASIAEAFLRMTLLLLLLLLTNFYQIFMESCHFENPVETCQKWKFVVGAEWKYIGIAIICFSKFLKNILTYM